MANYGGKIIVFDTETGGLDCEKKSMTDIAMVVIDPMTWEIIDTYQSYIQPYGDASIGIKNDTSYDKKALEMTGLSFDFLSKSGKDIKTVMKEVKSFIESKTSKGARNRTINPIIAGHNVSFDIGFLSVNLEAQLGVDLFSMVDSFVICTMKLMQLKYPSKELIENHKLSTCCSKYGINLVDAHGAMPDTMATAQLLIKLLNSVSSEVSSIGTDNNNGRERFRF